MRCRSCGHDNSILRVLVYWSGVHLRCRGCGLRLRVVHSVSGLFLTFLAFVVAYAIAFWWLSAMLPVGEWRGWRDPVIVVGMPLVPGAVAALLVLALAARGEAPPPEQRLSTPMFATAYAFALVSSVTLLLGVWAAGVLLRTREPMPAVSVPARPTAEVIAGLDGWTFEILGGERRTIGSLRGKPVFLQFWQPSDDGIIDVLASVRRLRKHASDVYYVSVGRAPDDVVRRFVEERAPRFPYVTAVDPVPEGLARLVDGARTSTFFLDAEGRLAFVHHGTARWDTAAVERFLAGLR